MAIEQFHCETANKLFAAHPLIFKGLSPRCPCDLPAGWYRRVDRLCTDIENALSHDQLMRLRVNQFKEKLASLTFSATFNEERDADVDPAAYDAHGALVADDAVIRAVLSSAGVEDGSPLKRVRAHINEASKDCEAMCQVCGEPGEVVPTYWIQVLCEKHRQEMIERSRERVKNGK